MIEIIQIEKGYKMGSNLFDSEIKNLEALTKSGAFGSESQNLLKKRGEISTQEFIYLSFCSIYDDPNFDYETLPYIIDFMDLFREGQSTNPQAMVDIITASMVGDKNNLQLETMSSYTRFLTEHQILKNNLSEMSKERSVDPLKRIELANAILHDYSNGFEYCMKLFTFIIAIARVVNGKEYDLQIIDKQPSSNKLNLFRQIDGGKHNLLVDGWDDRIRNADSHASIVYNPQTCLFEGKNNHYQKTDTGKIRRVEEFTITPVELLTKVIPRVGRFIHGYLGASYLLYLVNADREYYDKAVVILKELSK
ncbi:hypothetical protein [Companilactobacillus nantensis]|uniref:hypothetical protein n=1 Tax=Companilactobacillus nantensis TaxID=305793 RepID=UPI0011BE9101|nr:hypothetical protein [Companilactobacillus nantensis]